MTDEPRSWKVVIYGAPRTKKTSNRIHLIVPKERRRLWVNSLRANNVDDLSTAILSKVRIQPSSAWRKWVSTASIVPVAWMLRDLPLKCDLTCEATFYRKTAIGDLVGYLQGLADLLEKRGLIKNDRQIVGWDGSRLSKDERHPRVELILTEVLYA